MIPPREYDQVADQLQRHVRARFPDAAVQIADGLHYRGTNIVVTSKSFAGLLPEQRYGLVLRTIPEAFFKKYLRGGVVWFELAPGERGEDYMKMPRSEDVVARAAAVLARLKRAGVIKQLEKAVAAGAASLDSRRLALLEKHLSVAGLTAAEQADARLVLVGRGALCDADLPRVLCALAEDD